AVLQRADHLQPGAVAYVAETFESVAAEGALENVAAGSAVKERAPLLQFAYAVGRLLGVELGHAPVVEHFAAAHGVTEVSLPTVGSVHVGHGRGNATFGHHGMRFTQE